MEEQTVQAAGVLLAGEPAGVPAVGMWLPERFCLHFRGPEQILPRQVQPQGLPECFLAH